MDTPDNIFQLENITHTKLKRLDREHTLVMCAMSPIEVHGPHLPLGQDWFEARALADHAVRALAAERPDWNFLFTPPIPISIECVPHLGSISYPVQVVRDVAYHTLRPFAKHGFARLAYSSFHGSPRHICALEDAADALSKEYKTAAISLFSAAVSRLLKGNIFFEAVEDAGLKITQSQLSKDTHAGFVETSLALHLWPELVEPGWEHLPPSTATPEDGEQKSSFLMGKKQSTPLDKLRDTIERIQGIVDSATHFQSSTYSGYPAIADAEMGRRMFERLVELTKDLMSEFLDTGAAMDGHSPLWKLRGIFLNGAVNRLADDVLKIYTY
jgi:creatinine amidohydrolase